MIQGKDLGCCISIHECGWLPGEHQQYAVSRGRDFHGGGGGSGRRVDQDEVGHAGIRAQAMCQPLPRVRAKFGNIAGSAAAGEHEETLLNLGHDLVDAQTAIKDIVYCHRSIEAQ